jgi:hypothetical protein
VRRFRGCLDGLPPMQRTALILRYGVGPVQARSVKQTARLLDVSRGRVRLVERRGVRNLAGAGQDTSCERTGISAISLASVYELLTGSASSATEGLSPPLAAGVRLANAASAALDADGGAVAGARESGGERRDPSPEREADEDDVSSAGPSLANPFGSGGAALDNPLFLLLLAIVVACLASAAREIRRAVR